MGKRILSLKGAICMMLFVLTLGFASCDKSNQNESVGPKSNMEQMYVESKNLPETSIDSIKSFTSKFGNYIKANPASMNNEYYNPTVENISYACSVFGYQLNISNTGITINTEWDGETIINY